MSAREIYLILAPLYTGEFVCSYFGVSFFGDAVLSEVFIHVSVTPGRLEGQKMRIFESSPFAQQASRSPVHVASFQSLIKQKHNLLGRSALLVQSVSWTNLQL